MLIKHTALSQHLKRPLSPVYLLIGQDDFLITQAVKDIKAAWKVLHPDSEYLYFAVEHPRDWSEVYDEAHHGTLFAEHKLLDTRYNKKSFDKAEKNLLTEYLASAYTQNLLLIQAPFVTQKTLSFCTSRAECTVVQINSLNAYELQHWIKITLDQVPFIYTPDVIDLILQYTQGNHLACAQLIQKLTLIHSPGHALSLEEVRVHLSVQCQYELFELAEACLSADLEKALLCVRLAIAQKTEPVLILWVLTQEIRLLVQLNQHLQQGASFHEAAARLNIWAKRVPAYRSALKRLEPKTLNTSLSQCQTIDQAFKLGKIKNIALEIEQLIFRLYLPSTPS